VLGNPVLASNGEVSAARTCITDGTLTGLKPDYSRFRGVCHPYGTVKRHNNVLVGLLVMAGGVSCSAGFSAGHRRNYESI
jgi:hypothetical protein